MWQWWGGCTIVLTNSMTNMFVSANGGNTNVNGLSSFKDGNGNVVMSIESYMSLPLVTSTDIGALIDQLAALLVGGPLEPSTKTTIQNFVANATYFPMTGAGTNPQKRDRVRAAVHLIITSAEYAAQK